MDTLVETMESSDVILEERVELDVGFSVEGDEPSVNVPVEVIESCALLDADILDDILMDPVRVITGVFISLDEIIIWLELMRGVPALWDVAGICSVKVLSIVLPELDKLVTGDTALDVLDADAVVERVVKGAELEPTRHEGCALMMLSSSVTAASNAYNPPLMLAPVLRLILVRAIMLPLKLVRVSRVAEEPTCQNMLHA